MDKLERLLILAC